MMLSEEFLQTLQPDTVTDEFELITPVEALMPEVLANGQNGSRKHARMDIDKTYGVREFIAWDGEGTKAGDRKPQNYSLFGCSTGDYIVGERLHSRECLEFIISIGQKHPHAFHVGFAFDYDTNMILKNLSPTQLRIMKDKGSLYIGHFRIEHVLSKWLQVTKYGRRHPRRNQGAGDSTDKHTVRIADIFGFFQSSFVVACKGYIPDHPLMGKLDIIERGKDQRKYFTYERIQEITEYWTVEIQLLQALVERLREMLFSVGLRITQWHGPGAIANHVYKNRSIKQHKSVTPPEVRKAARYGYAGGRFELFRLGRHQHVYGIDINSAYPYAISQLPSLSEGYWRHVVNPTDIVEFGIYHVKLAGFPGPVRKPAPLFHRDSNHNISFPWVLEGWYWSPEIKTTLGLVGRKGYEIIEGYEYVGWSSRPFQFVGDMYSQRRELKRIGAGGQHALKLALNSLYGKMAQRVGWERNGKPPTWHQLEWAGWVTSATRAKLFAVMARIPWISLIAVETDGIYTTIDPRDIGLTSSTELGGWEFTEYEEMLYVQSGVYYALHSDKGWIGHYRGLDKDSLDETRITEYLRNLRPMEDWKPISGRTTRFIGYRSAIHREDQNRGPMKVHHCRWEDTPREISPSKGGKRVHSPKMCQACKDGATAYEAPHDLVIRSTSFMNPHSEMHSIPWEDKDSDDTIPWRKYAKEIEDELSYV